MKQVKEDNIIRVMDFESSKSDDMRLWMGFLRSYAFVWVFVQLINERNRQW